MLRTWIAHECVPPTGFFNANVSTVVEIRRAHGDAILDGRKPACPIKRAMGGGRHIGCRGLTVRVALKDRKTQSFLLVDLANLLGRLLE
jgi:hypothetical protein